MQVLLTMILMMSMRGDQPASPIKSSAALEQKVNQLIDQMLLPTEAGLNAILMDNLSYGHSNGHIDTKASLKNSLLSGESDFTDIKVTDQQIEIVDKTAFVRHNIDCKTLNGGTPGTANLKVLLLWVYQKGTWKLMARQAVKNI